MPRQIFFFFFFPRFPPSNCPPRGRNPAGKVLDPGQPARIRLFWPGKGRIQPFSCQPTGIRPFWPMKGQPALQIPRCSHRPFRSRRPAEKREEEEELERERKRALDSWLSKSRDAVTGRSDPVVRLH
jgi:hypothetical protein